MSEFTGVDLSQLPPPNLVEVLDFELILQDMKNQLNGLQPILFADTTSQPTIKSAELVEEDSGDKYWRIPYVEDESGLLYLELESEPMVKQLEVSAYRELLVRQRVNEAALAGMLAYAKGADLEHIGATSSPKVYRLQLDPGDLEADPVIEPTYEDDTDYRSRIQLAPEGLSTAGPEGGYIYHALSASADVKSASAIRPSAGNITATILSINGDGTAPQSLIETVENALFDAVRPMGDDVLVQGATISSYTVIAELEYGDGVVPENILQAAIDAVTEYTDTQHRIGASVALSGLYAALHQAGVTNVTLSSPAADITTTDSEAPYCSGITVTRAT